RVRAREMEEKILTGVRARRGGWACRAAAAPALGGAFGAPPAEPAAPAGLLVDYHLDEGDGLLAIAALRRAIDPALPAILVTADRTAAVRAAAHAQDIQVLHKPIKPAALRALLGQWRMHRVAAE